MNDTIFLTGVDLDAFEIDASVYLTKGNETVPVLLNFTESPDIMFSQITPDQTITMLVFPLEDRARLQFTIEYYSDRPRTDSWGVFFMWAAFILSSIFAVCCCAIRTCYRQRSLRKRQTMLGANGHTA